MLASIGPWSLAYLQTPTHPPLQLQWPLPCETFFFITYSLMCLFHTYFIGIGWRHSGTLAREHLNPGSTTYLSCDLDQVP